MVALFINVAESQLSKALSSMRKKMKNLPEVWRGRLTESLNLWKQLLSNMEIIPFLTFNIQLTHGKRDFCILVDDH